MTLLEPDRSIRHADFEQGGDRIAGVHSQLVRQHSCRIASSLQEVFGPEHGSAFEASKLD